MSSSLEALNSASEEEAQKLTELAHDNAEIVILNCHGRGMCETAILILVFRYNWLVTETQNSYSSTKKIEWRLGNYFVQGTPRAVCNFAPEKYLFSNDEQRQDWIQEHLLLMIKKFIQESI